ncbi:MAG: hypothetical protein ABI255_03450 [Microbacteriaceae bacterium]
MQTRTNLPPGLIHKPFAVRDALDAGVTRKRLRARDLYSNYWGTRTTTTGALNLREKCTTLQTRIPSHAHFSHLTAALLLGAPMPLWAERDPRVHVSVPSPHRALSAAGVVGHKVQSTDADTAVLHGIRMTTPARTWCELATVLTVPDLVAVGDYLIHWRMPLATRRQLEAAVASYPGRRGRRVLRQAIDLLSNEAESRPESILRVILVLGGLPLPQVNRSVAEADGQVFARLDLRYEQEKVAIEYQGDYHRTSKGQWRKDMSRRARLEAKGWYVIEINADDLHEPEELVRLIRSVLIKRRASIC